MYMIKPPECNYLVLICCSICLAWPLMSQTELDFSFQEVLDTTTSFENFTINDGLASNQVLDVIHDRFGYIWFATASGLSRFDGASFVNFFHDPKKPSSLSNSYVTCLAEDSNGHLWIGTKEGLNRLNRKDYSFEHYKRDKYNSSSIPGDYIRAMLADTASIIWLETANGFLSRFETINKKFTSYGHKAANQRYANHSINKTSDGNLIVLGRELPPIYFDVENEKLTHFAPDCIEQSTFGYMDSDLFEDKNGNFWMANSAGPSFLVTDDFTSCTFNTTLISIYDMLQVSDGQLWMGGWRTGALAIDLEHLLIRRYKQIATNTKSIVNNYINKIFEDKEGNIWFATMGGVSKLSQEKPITHILNDKGSNNISALVPQSDSVLWIGTIDDGLYRYNPLTRKFTGHWSNPFLHSNAISCLYLDSEGLLWIGLWAGAGFHIFDLESGTIEVHQICPTSRTSDWYNDIIETSPGNIVLGAWGPGPLQFSKEEKDFSGKNMDPAYQEKFPVRRFEIIDGIVYNSSNPFFIPTYEVEKGKYKYAIFSEKKEPNCNSRFQGFYNQVLSPWLNDGYRDLNFDLIDDKIWFARPTGLFIMDTTTLDMVPAPIQTKGDTILDLIASPDGQKLYLVSNSHFYQTQVEASPAMLSKRFPLGKRLQNTQSSYLAVDGDEVFIFDAEVLQIYHSKESTFSEFDFQEDGIQDLKISSHFIWVVTGKKLTVLSRENLQAVELKITDRNYSLANNINTIEVISDTEYWLGTDVGLFHIDLSQDQVTPFFHIPIDPFSLPSDQILNIKKDNSNQIWIATHKGLCKYLDISQNFERHNQNSNDGLASKHTTCLLEDHSGRLWIGSNQGILDCYDPNSEIFKCYAKEPWNPNSLQPSLNDNAINSIYEDSKNRLWVGGGSLSLFREETQDFNHFRPENENPFNDILSIIEDDFGRLWLGTDRGLYVFNPELEIFNSFGLEDNIQSLEFGSAACRLTTGELAFGGANGFNLIDFSQKDRSAFDPVILGFRFKAGSDLYIEDLQTREIPKLSYSQRSVQLDIAVMDLNKGNKIRFRLADHEKDWNIREAKDRTLIYNNLPAGDFTLEIYAGNSMGNWSTHSKTFHFSIAPHWSDTWGFWVATCLAFGLISFRLFKWQQKKQMEEREKALRLKFLEVKSLQSQMNPHFVFNVLGSMQNLILKREPKEANINLVRLSTLIRRFLESTANINMPKRLSFYNSEIPLEEEEELIRMYIEFEQLQYRGNFEYDLSIDDRINKANFMIPPMIIQPYVENAIKHGLLYKEENDGQLNIKFNLIEEDVLECIIEDNGVGRKKAFEIQERSFKRYKSLGTQLVFERVGILNQLGYNIKLDTIDRPKGGTIVSIKIDRNYDD